MDKIICVGKNYLDHAKELGDAVPDMPVLFLKPPSVAKYAKNKGDLIQAKLPKNRGTVHHECEIVCLVNASGAVQAVTLGLDLTLRDLQGELKKKGHPWEISKVFQDSAIIGPWIELPQFPDFLEKEFSFVIDGQVKQRGKGSQMSFSPEKCLNYSKEYFPLCSGDVLFSGTPAGVGPLSAGQKAQFYWNNELLFEVQFTD